MPYIKSHSNYVLQQKHQNIKDGTIFERDITTIGGVNQFSPNQTPIYRSNNFIITVRDDGRPSNQFNTEKWEENGVSGEVWTINSISGLTSDTVADDDTKIVLKQDYYDFRDFAYYGSLTELFRASVTDIVSKFPGELYVTDKNAYYTSGYTIDGEKIEESVILGNDEYKYIDNPFGINIYSNIKPNDIDKLKYFTEEGYKNYILFSGDTYEGDESNYVLTSWESEWYYSELNPNRTNNEDKYINYTATTVSTTVLSNTSSVYKPCKGDCMAKVTVSTSSISGTIEAFIGDNDEIIYLTKDLSNDTHIRPKKEFLDKFFNECDNFERLLMNKDTDYKTTFSVIREDDNGYYREFVPFTFPRGMGGYNIDTSDYGFNAYTQQMVEIGEYYDENFTDNLWRSMTHEAIKNFDWTYTREFNEGDEEEYVFGGQRIQKALRIFAREFDEILAYINNIKSANRVTYDERSNLPDYFLTDAVENSGFDVKLIYPYSLTEKDIDGNTNEDYVEGGNDNCYGQLNNTNSSGGSIIREFSQNASDTFVPYPFENWGHFNLCSGVISSSSKSDTTRYDANALGGKGVTKNVVRNYFDDIIWTNQKANNEFLRRLKINAPYIWRTKGTVEGIEMILGMFGLKSKRWADAKGIDDYDFEVTEYTSFAHRIEELWDAEHQEYRINWVNSTKAISYDNRSISNYNKYGLDGEKIPYQGIPISYRDEYVSAATPYIGKASGSLNNQINSGITPSTSASAFTREDNSKVLRRYLYPNFNSNEALDGNPYFQMNGGWLSKIIESSGNSYNFQYDVDDNIVYTMYNSGSSSYTTDDSHSLYKETVRNIRRVDDIDGLLSIPTNNLYNGVICNVTRVETNAAVIDGVVYPILSEWYGEGTSAKSVNYISLVKSDGYIKVGQDKYFDSTIIVYDGNMEETIYDIESKSDGYEIKAYISGNLFTCKEDYDGDYTISSFVNLNNIWSSTGVPYTNYFILDDVNYATEIARWNDAASGYTSGWRRLNTSDSDYIKANTIINYYKGNNPHNGNMVYDNGHEYFTYFKRIFKYAVDNELFDSRCYNDFYASIDDEIAKYGFSGLVNPNEDVKQYDNFLIEDSKIHYFGNYKTRSTNGKIDKVFIYGEDSDRLNGFQEKYSNEANSVENYILNSNKLCDSNNPYRVYNENNVDEVTNQIVNNKRLLINFNLHNKWYEKIGQEELKYLDDIVMNYLTQMIPSSTILQIKYTSK